MPKLYPEPLLFCLAWAALAIIAGILGSIWMGILFSAGLALVLMPLTAFVVSKTGDFAVERQVRWGLLVMAALALTIWLGLQSSSSS
jgi:predicted PurR-regulated permease PerM